MEKTIHVIIFLCLLIFVLHGCSDDSPTSPEGSVEIGPITAGDPAQNLQEFEAILERLRNQLKIPGFSAAIVKNRKIIWAEGFGYANVEDKKTATPTTAYHLASLTKTFASTIIMQLVEEGLLDLEAPVSDFGIEIQSSDTVRVKHLLTHTSEGIPGSFFRYSGDRFGLLDDVIVEASGRSFSELLVERIIEPLGLENTVPNLLNMIHCPLTWPERIEFAENLAQGYTSDGSERQAYPTYFGTAAGLISSVIDVAKYSIAIDNHVFLTEETQALVFSPAVSNNGATLPYGLGWFVQQYFGLKIVWHYGWWTANSSLIVKVPERDLTFIILANTDMLSRAFPTIGYGDISVSVVALEFLNGFVFGNAELPDAPVSPVFLSHMD
jgi:CubicO group peptidase (beta-lactamase class C family)